MIRINLLPEPRTKGAKKQWDVRIEAAGAAVVIVLIVIACFWYASELDAEIQAKQLEAGQGKTNCRPAAAGEAG